MPETNDALYSRGKYRLVHDRRADGTLRSPNYQIVWWDDAVGHTRSKSTGVATLGAAEDALDRHFLERERGQTVCPTCQRPIENAGGHLLTNAIADYLLAREDRPSIGSMKPRLAHVLDYLDAINRQDITCDHIDDTFIDAFRSWSAKQVVVEGTVNPKTRDRSPGTTEASVRSLAAAINFAHNRKDTSYKAGFSALAPRDVSRTPTYRSDVKELASMFRYCLEPRDRDGKLMEGKKREQALGQRLYLLRFLQISVATWCRPDAAHDLSVERGRDQWLSNARVVQLNPRGRRQTKKYRPAVPVPAKFAAILDEADGFLIPVKSVRKAFESMLDALGLPRERETGLKLIRRSIAQIVRRRIGEERWTQGEMMLGHRKASTSDLYALFDPANLGVALAATEAVIDEIIALSPGAFSTGSAGIAPGLRLVGVS